MCYIQGMRRAENPVDPKTMAGFLALNDYHPRKVPTYCDLISIREFRENVFIGTFTDSDGSGEAAVLINGRFWTKNEYVKPSTVRNSGIHHTHILVQQMNGGIWELNQQVNIYSNSFFS